MFVLQTEKIASELRCKTEKRINHLVRAMCLCNWAATLWKYVLLIQLLLYSLSSLLCWFSLHSDGLNLASVYLYWFVNNRKHGQWRIEKWKELGGRRNAPNFFQKIVIIFIYLSSIIIILTSTLTERYFMSFNLTIQVNKYKDITQINLNVYPNGDDE